MGGKNPVSDTIKGAVNSGINLATGGIYNPETGTIKTGEDQLNNVVTSASGQRIVNASAPKAPSIPKAEDPSVAAARAKAEADAKFAKELGEKGKGLASTVLGGSVSADQSILKKKKLLGE